METLIHTEILEVPEGGPQPESPLILLMDGMQEAAGHHAEILGWGIRDLQAKGLTWVLARNHLRLLQPVADGTHYRIQTWPSGRRPAMAIRDFRVLDPAGHCVLEATSGWIIIQLSSRRPIRLGGDGFDIPSRCERVIDDPFSSLPAPAVEERPRTFRVGPEEIDINDHVNNLVYFEWALASLPAAVLSGLTLQRLEMAFLGEALLGDRVACHSQSVRVPESGGEVWVQRLQEESSGRELARLRSRWNQSTR